MSHDGDRLTGRIRVGTGHPNPGPVTRWMRRALENIHEGNSIREHCYLDTVEGEIKITIEFRPARR